MIEPLAIIGTGRVASVLSTALHRKGVRIAAVAGRNSAKVANLAKTIGAQALLRNEQVAEVCAHALVAVSDDALEQVLPELNGCRVVLHTSGATGYFRIAASVASGVLHPLQTFPDARAQDLSQFSFAYGGDDAAAALALRLIQILGAMPLRVASDKWAHYHAAAVFASNYQVTLLDAAFELMQAAGIDRAQACAALAPLTRSAVENTFREGPETALTGPVSRADAKTIRLHLAAIAEPAMRELYIAAAKRTLQIAARGGLDTERVREVLR